MPKYKILFSPIIVEAESIEKAYGGDFSEDYSDMIEVYDVEEVKE